MDNIPLLIAIAGLLGSLFCSTRVLWLLGRRGPASRVRTVAPSGVEVDVGRLRVEAKPAGAVGKEGFALGYGCRVELDGKPVENLKSLTLRLRANDIVTAELEVLA